MAGAHTVCICTLKNRLHLLDIEGLQATPIDAAEGRFARLAADAHCDVVGGGLVHHRAIAYRRGWRAQPASKLWSFHVLDRRTHRSPQGDVGQGVDRQPDRRRSRRGQPQCRDRQGASPGPRVAPVAGQGRRGKGQGFQETGRAEESRGLQLAAPKPPVSEAPPAAALRPMSRRAMRRRAPAPIRPLAPSTAADHAAPRQPPQQQLDPNMQYRSVGPGGFIRQGPGDTQAPIPPAPPRRLVPAKPSAEVADKTSLLELNDRVCRWPMGHPGRARLPLLRQCVEPGLSLLRRSLRGRLPGAIAAPRPPAAAAAAVRWTAGPLDPIRS